MNHKFIYILNELGSYVSTYYWMQIDFSILSIFFCREFSDTRSQPLIQQYNFSFSETSLPFIPHYDLLKY